MNKLITFYNNIKYLFKHNLNEDVDNLNYSVEHLKYELEDDLKKLKRIEIKDASFTLDKLISSNCSICRFGDGEINLLVGNSIPFQKSSKKLSEKLEEVLRSNNPNVMLGIPLLFRSYEGVDFFARKVTRAFYGKYNDYITSFLNQNQEYYCAGVTFPYINATDKSQNFKEYYEKFATIWNKKDIAIICEDRVFKNIKYNIFNSANSIEYLYTKSKNAFDDYNDILTQAKKISKDKTIIIILGPTATVLAYDLTLLGYRAIDIGHIAKDYDAWMKNLPSNAKIITEFFNPD